ncbi:MAG: PilZ domain-containing protein [Sandaracinaceae bacterium]|nr:PilZ domain-containing protein [Sandaracinaceae bacterium]
MVVVHEGGELQTVSKNISLGGMYLITDQQLPYGTKVELRMYLPALKEDVLLAAVVRWQKDDGMGVQYGSLRAREVWGFNQLFKESKPSTD